MGSINHGTQEITYEYFESATAEEFNKRNLDIRSRGIYSGGYLNRVSDVEITLSLLSAEIGDDGEQISVQTTTVATLNVSTLDAGAINSTTPYLVLRWNFLTQKNNYVEVHALSSLTSVLDNDIVIGKCEFSGAILTGFDYTDRTFINDSKLVLKVEVSTGLYVQLRAGKIQNGSASIFVSEQTVGPFSVPGSPNSRIDLVYIADDGTPTIVQGSIAVSPVVPDYGSKLVVAEVTVVNGVTSIVADKIKDVRALITSSIIPDDDSLELNSFGHLAIKDFADLLSANGYTHLGGGLILQWGSVSVNPGATINVTLPKTYVIAHLWAAAFPKSNSTHTSVNENASSGGGSNGLSQVQIRNGVGVGVARTFSWLSLGR